MKHTININEYIDGIFSGNITYLSKAITLVESTKTEHQEFAQQIIDGVIHKSGNSFRLGITGAPGVGKSTFIESFGLEVINQGRKLAVLAIDPSSSISKGSILGDKTRMEKLSINPNAFIRPTPSLGSLGGVARKTKETILLCEAAGYNYIIVETVGVGQSETMVHQLTDFFLLLMLAGAGDELQGIKRGIMEMADALVITKADGENKQNATHALLEYKNALHLFPPAESSWTPQVLACSSTENRGIKEVYNVIQKYQLQSNANGYFHSKRISQNIQWLKQTINETLISNFYNNASNVEELKKAETQLNTSSINPFKIVDKLLHHLRF